MSRNVLNNLNPKEGQYSAGQKLKQTNPKNHQPVQVKQFTCKFMGYLNKLNSSILNCHQKSNMSRISKNQYKRRSIQSSVSSHRSHSSTNPRRNFNKDAYKVIEGNKVNGKCSGYAVVIFNNGALFKGQMEEGELKEGKIVFQDGTEYEGGFKKGLFDGIGRLKNNKGSSYYGHFTLGVLQKIAEISYQNGDIYKGQVVNYKKHGEGQLKINNGNCYIGQFADGEITGFGIYYVNGFPTAEGTWLNGEFIRKSHVESEDQDASSTKS